MMMRVMLWALGAAAVLGAAAILIGDIGGIWRIRATAMMTEIAAGLMITTGGIADKARTRPAGLLGMAVIVVEFLLVMMLTWDINRALMLSDSPFWVTAFSLALCTPPAMVFVTLRQQEHTRRAAVVGLALTAIVLVCSLIGAWVASSSRDDNWFATAAAVAGFGLLMVASLIRTESHATQPRGLFALRAVGVLAAGLAMLMAVFGIWQDIHSGSDLFAVITTIALVTAHANLCLLAPLSDGQRWIRWITITAGVLTGVMWSLLIMDDARALRDGPLIRFASASGFVTACGSLALLVMYRLNRKVTDETPVLTEISAVTLVCPGCRKKQTLPIGASTCPTCRLQFEIQLREPRCPKCDYLLFMLTSDTCPECGCALATPST